VVFEAAFCSTGFFTVFPPTEEAFFVGAAFACEGFVGGFFAGGIFAVFTADFKAVFAGEDFAGGFFAGGFFAGGFFAIFTVETDFFTIFFADFVFDSAFFAAVAVGFLDVLLMLFTLYPLLVHFLLPVAKPIL